MCSSNARNEQKALVASVLDGAVRSISTIGQNLAGKSLTTWQGAIVSTLCAEVMRFVVGAYRLFRSELRLVPSGAQLLLMAVWAVGAVLMTVLHVASYEIGADQGVATMIVLMSIVPGALIDRFAFREALSWRQALGILLFLGGAWAVLGFPGWLASVQLPWWVWFKAAIAVLLAMNEGVRKQMATLKQASARHSFESSHAQFWVGIFSLTLLLGAGSFFGIWRNLGSFTAQFWIGSAIMGSSVVVSTVLSLIPYFAGGSIVFRKFVTNVCYLVFSMLFGIFFFHEAVTAGKFVGVAVFILAMLTFNFKAKTAR